MIRKQTLPCLSLPLVSLLPFLFFFALSPIPLSFAVDTISANQSLSGNQILTSINGTFALGFYKPGNSSNYYISIWYNKVSQLTAVWVANRASPVTDNTLSELKISDDGNLVLLNQSKSMIWSTEANITSSSTVAVLLDSGNLQLRDESNSSKVFWQSFDHPTDTWLPGSKLGLNKKTKKDQQLIAWKNTDDPAPGIFALELDPNGTSQYFILWNNSRIFWSSGTWNGHIFSLVPEMTENYLYNFQYVSNDEENYFTYSMKDNSILSRFVMDVSGQITQTTWVQNQEWILFWSQPTQQCQVYALCGPFGTCNSQSQPYCICMKGFSKKYPDSWALNDQSGGCLRNTPLRCERKDQRKSEQDKFLPMPNVRLPDSQQKSAAESDEDCASACLSSCSCSAYSYNGSGCFVWYGDLLNLEEQYDGSDAGTLKLRLAASELPSSKSNKGMIIGVTVGVLAGFLICLAIIWLLIRRRRRRRILSITTKAAGGTLIPFRYSEMQYFTRNFSEKLGGGGFGSVFKGSLPDSTTIAVKKLEGFHQGEKQFRTEVSTIGTIQHVNLVRLRGFCSKGTHKLLVYEYMPNGSLDTRLFHSNSAVLDWKTRYQIAIGTARGLAYLHEECRDRIIHCDIKPENILLDASFVPKVADFGLAKLVGRDFSRVLTTMRGTRGYLAPEWITGVAITSKADVYSYGMMLLEIVSGRRNLEQTEDGRTEYFPTLASSKLAEGDVESLLDPKLSSDASLEELEKACKIACWCIQDDENLRPTMGQVVKVLEGFLEVNTPPIPRSVQVMAERPTEEMKFFSDSSSAPTSYSNQTKSTSSDIADT